MAQQTPPSPHPDEEPKGDPWHAFGYLVSGVLVYGLIGWALDRWLDTGFLVVIGILTGVGLGIFMTWKRFNAPWSTPSPPPSQSPPDPGEQR